MAYCFKSVVESKDPLVPRPCPDVIWQAQVLSQSLLTLALFPVCLRMPIAWLIQGSTCAEEDELFQGQIALKFGLDFSLSLRA